MPVPCARCEHPIESTDPPGSLCARCREKDCDPKPGHKPSFWVSDDTIGQGRSKPAAGRSAQPLEPNSSLLDFKVLLEESGGPPPHLSSRRIVDDDLLRLQGPSLVPPVADFAPPTESIPAAEEDDEALDVDSASDDDSRAADATEGERCPRCGAGAARHVGENSPEPSEELRERVPSEPPRPVLAASFDALRSALRARSVPGTIEAAGSVWRARPVTAVPWTIAGASSIIALVAVLSASSRSSPVTAPIPEPSAHVASLDAVRSAQAEQTREAVAPPSEPTEAPIASPGEAPSADEAALVAPSPSARARVVSVEPRGAVASQQAPSPAADTRPAGLQRSFDRAAAMSALSSAAAKASACRKGTDPKGLAKVTVTFGPAGRATQAQVGPPFAGTKTGSCVVSIFRSATVPPFEGQPVPASKTVTLR